MENFIADQIEGGYNMFFQTKKKKIEQYLQKKESGLSPFDELLNDYLKGNMKDWFEQCRMTKLDFHIDWLDDYRCIQIQGRLHRYYVDIQIEETEFSVAFGEECPDGWSEYAVETKAQVYSVLEEILKGLAEIEE